MHADAGTPTAITVLYEDPPLTKDSQWRCMKIVSHIVNVNFNYLFTFNMLSAVKKDICIKATVGCFRGVFVNIFTCVAEILDLMIITVKNDA